MYFKGKDREREGGGVGDRGSIEEGGEPSIIQMLDHQYLAV